MTRNDFFNLLMDKLQYIPEKSLQKVIVYYNSLFETEIEKGKTEEDIINSLGNIDLLIDKIKSSSDYTVYDKNQNNLESKSDFSNDQAYEDTPNKTAPLINNLNETPSVSTTNNQDADKHKNSLNQQNTNSAYINGILKVGILVLFVIIAFPVLSGLAGFVLGLFGTSLGLFTGSLGILIGRSFFNLASIPEIPQFITTIPYSALVFLCLGTMSLGIVLFFYLFYLTKAFFLLLKHIFIKVLP